MKKSLSLILALAMVFTMFASVAFAADGAAAPTTAQEQFNFLKDKGIFSGDENGNANLDQSMTRAQVAKIVSLLVGAQEDASAASVYTDLEGAGWAAGYIGAATKAGLMIGVADGKFAPSGEFTTEQLATVLVRVLKLEQSTDAVNGTVSAWAQGYVAAAINAGLIQASADFTTPALREALVNASYVAYTKIEEANKLVATVKQTGARELTVSFNKAAAADVAVVVKSSYLTVDGTVAFAADRKSATFTANENEVFGAGDYTVEVTGLDAIPVKVEAAKLASLKFTQTGLQAIANNVVKYEGVDQFGGKFDVNTTEITASAFNVTDGAALTVNKTAVGELTITNALLKDKNVLISVVHNTGIQAQVTVAVDAASVVSSVKLGEVKPLADKTRIMQNDQNLVLPITLVDQYNNAMTLNDANLAGVTFISSDASVVDMTYKAIAADADGNPILTFDAKDKAGTVTITAFVPATAAQASATVVVNSNAALKAVTLKQPVGLFVANEAINADFTAIDQYNAAYTLAKGDLYWVSTDKTVVDPDTADLQIVDGKVVVTPEKEGSVTISAFLNGALQGQLSFNVQPAAAVTKIKGLADGTVTKFVYDGGEYTYKATDFVILDQYNRVLTTDTNVLRLSDANLSLTRKDGSSVTVSGLKVVGAVTGDSTLVATYAGKTFEFKTTTVNARDVVKYDVTVPAITTIYSNGSVNTASAYAAKFVLNYGYDKDNNKVAVVPGFDSIISSDNANVTADTVTGTVYSSSAADAKEALVLVFKNGQQIATVNFKTSTAAPAAATVNFKDDVKTELNNESYDFGAQVEVKDQYGVAYAVDGSFYSSDSAVLVVNTATGAATIAPSFSGEATVTVSYVTTNAKIIQLTVKVTK